MLLSVIVVSYNTAALTLQTLRSVLEDSEKSALLKDQTEIWVVDNNSSDTSVANIKALAKTTKTPIQVIENRDNKGFSSANNQAILKSQGGYVLLLNSDTIVKAGALELLVKNFIQQNDSEATSVLASYKNVIDRLGILSAQLLNTDGTLQPQGGTFPGLIALTVHMLFLDDIPVVGKWLPSTQHTGRNSRPENSHTSLVRKDWVAGTVMMIKRAVIDEIGLLDDEIFMYGEDMEYCLRAAHHHWDCAIDLQAEIVHYGSASSSSKNAIVGEMKAYRYIWSKHKPLWQIPVARVILVLGCLLRILVFGTISHNPAKVTAYQAALSQV